MRSQRTKLHFWLTTRIRLLCVSVFVVSLFVPPYVAANNTALPDIELDNQQFMLAEDGFLLKTSALTEQGTRRAFAEGIIHTVEPKESIEGIAKLYDLKADTIRNANELDSKAVLKPGQKILVLPVDGVLHTVKRGQNLGAIADLYSVPSDSIVQQNKIKSGYLLAGQELIIPGGKPLVEPPKPGTPVKPTKPVIIAGKPTVPKVQYSIEPTYGVLQRPCECFMTQGYNGAHYGVDLQERGGGPNFAAEGGTVIRADYGWNGGYGNVIEVDHGNGMVTLYAHNKTLHVQEGDQVKRGQYIADMGNTGLVHGPTGIHLHFEVHVNGVKRNPLLYLND
ncbi:MAG: peptidoglycan DD-metalloendopeptidase family protein [Candidatus Peribacteraceae bacterium]|nr:peptidoglycan DD-metalloendopeptidase family protein [Candidatus Peribacteraceae bacterium]